MTMVFLQRKMIFFNRGKNGNNTIFRKEFILNIFGFKLELEWVGSKFISRVINRELVSIKKPEIFISLFSIGNSKINILAGFNIF
jgi:hypothetical protein